jgi:hypothetical protein
MLFGGLVFRGQMVLKWNQNGPQPGPHDGSQKGTKMIPIGMDFRDLGWILDGCSEVRRPSSKVRRPSSEVRSFRLSDRKI